MGPGAGSKAVDTVESASKLAWTVNRERTLKPRACILVPEVDGTVGTAGRECAMHRVPIDVVDCVHEGLVLGVGGVIPSVTLKREVVPKNDVGPSVKLLVKSSENTY
jgi:hypothetical protein